MLLRRNLVDLGDPTVVPRVATQNEALIFERCLFKSGLCVRTARTPTFVKEAAAGRLCRISDRGPTLRHLAMEGLQEFKKQEPAHKVIVVCLKRFDG